MGFCCKFTEIENLKFIGQIFNQKCGDNLQNFKKFDKKD